jgi:hypothetical protein
MIWGELSDRYTWGVLGATGVTGDATYTDTLNLEKPGLNSTVDVDVINDNYDIIDEAIEKTQENTAMIESHTAQTNHSVGSYFMLDNVLHKATSAIASGETITSGSNATPITIEQALSALNSAVSTLQDSVTKNVKTYCVATDGNTVGFSISIPSQVSFIALYFDLGGRVFLIRHGSTELTFTYSKLLGSDFEGFYSTSTSAQIRVGNYIRGVFIVGAISKETLDLTTIGTYRL